MEPVAIAGTNDVSRALQAQAAVDSAFAHDRRGNDRRRGPTPFVSRYTLLGGRREGDRRLAATENQYVDRYEPWLVAVLVAIGALCALDAVFTLLYLQKGGSEANPLMARAIEWGPVEFMVLKCAVTNLGLLVLCVHKNFRYVKAIVCGLLGIYGLLFAYHLWLAAVVP